ncbi:TAXI family TRAP transporter solute-binding subunit [Congregibacter sp.]|uniref:TAXI family TRAP transporter solute-binding subunit n=1 Tax=Congregibacter sp. TaxID=2744308 RepID=UPI003F6CAFBE
MNRYWRFVGFLLLSGLSAAAWSTTALRLHPPDSQQLNFAALSAIVCEETGIRLEPDASYGDGDDPIESLLDDSAQLGIIENTRSFVSGVRTVLPLYESVVHLAARKDLSIDDLAQAERPLRLKLVHNSYTARLVLDLLFERAESLPESYELWKEGDAGRPDLLFYVGPINPHNTEWFPQGFSLVPLSKFDAAGAEFYIDGISFLVPQLRSTRIPALTYSLPGNEVGIDALAVDMLLVAHKSTDESLIYELTRVLLEQKPRFAAAEPALFRWMRADFDVQDLTFPLHRGARQYFDRDEPGFLERYAETLNLLVYLAALLVTGAVAFGRWRARRRKDRIDDFYLRVLELRRGAGFDDPARLLGELESIENEAFTALIDERLAADDSFRIFTELAEGLRRELKAAPEAGHHLKAAENSG